MAGEDRGVEETLERLRETLLSQRSPGGHWEGELSSSALSTATALSALCLRERAGGAAGPPEGRSGTLVRRGLSWLIENQNPDGGWGDTTLSLSNISTTCLAWAALSIAGDGGGAEGKARSAAAAWVQLAAGGLDPDLLAGAVERRYGRDRTFSAPILTVLALAGLLGPGKAGWRRVLQLPFELAACPQSWFRWLRLPVVSYALPALIAIGVVRHQHLPGRNPLSRALRRLALPRTLEVLERIQPRSGGFLEAVPLTSFVVMSLAASGRAGHPVARRGAEFLARAARPDGSWPIDQNLATWVTTLSVNALGAGSGRGGPGELLPEEDRRALREWLLAQQHLEEHPYTGAAPGGWAWTDLPGGVPDADDTAGALLALRRLGPPGEPLRRAARGGVCFLLGLQNRDGGVPTFCRGWGKLPFDRSSPDLTAHALLAWAAWRGEVGAGLSRRIGRASRRALGYLAREQRLDGSWVPLWFAHQSAPGEENPTYGTARVLAALGALGARPSAMASRAVRWLLEAQNPDGGWGGAKGVESSIEETGLALAALGSGNGERPESQAASRPEALHGALVRGAAWLVERTGRGRSAPPSPIGLYFARLWYFEKLYPWIFAVEGLNGLPAAPAPSRSPLAGRPAASDPQ